MRTRGECAHIPTNNLAVKTRGNEYLSIIYKLRSKIVFILKLYSKIFMFFKLYFKKIEFYVKFNIIKIEISKLETNAHFYK